MKTRKTPARPAPVQMTPIEAVTTLRDAAAATDTDSKPWNRIVKETARVAAEINPPLTVTLHLPRWCAKQWEEEAARAGLTVGDLMTFLATGDWRLDHVVAEGVSLLCEDTLEDLAETPARRGEDAPTKIAMQLPAPTIKRLLASAEAWAAKAA